MIKVLVGVSGIGKSRFAQVLRTNATKETIIISRDKLRELLFGYSEETIKNYYQRKDFSKCEKIITEHLEHLVHYNLSKGKDIILDNTHLKLKYVNNIKKKFYYTDIEFVDVSKKQGITDLRTICIERDSNRTRQVGEAVITNQIRDYQQLLKDFDFKPYFANIEPIVQDITLPKAILFDIDGTLAIKSDRSPYDWSKVGEDQCNDWVANIMGYYLDDPFINVIVCTGRDGICRQLTEKWLLQHGLSAYNEFHIRPEGNMEPDYIIKERMWRDIASRYYIECLYDDRDSVVRHSRLLGLNVAQVNYGDF